MSITSDQSEQEVKKNYFEFSSTSEYTSAPIDFLTQNQDLEETGNEEEEEEKEKEEEDAVMNDES
jgi:hypothetical protein